MEQARSAIRPADLCPLLTAVGDHGSLNRSWQPHRQAQSCFASEPMVFSERQYFEPRRRAQADPPISVVPAASEQTGLAGGFPANLPIVDYRNASDEELLAAARLSDEGAFVELTGRYAQMVYKRAFRILRNREDAEDVVQEAMLRAYTRLGGFRGSCGFSTWLFQIAINFALMQLRKRKVHSEVSFDQTRNDNQQWAEWEFPDPSPSAEEAYASQQTADLLASAVKRLPSGYRSVVEQYHGRELSLRETAGTVGITVAATKSRLQRARITMRSTLERSGSLWRMPVTKERETFQNPQEVAP